MDVFGRCAGAGAGEPRGDRWRGWTWSGATSARHSATDRCDALVSNPPYLTDGEYAALDPSVKRWEPAAALVSGPDGLDATSRLLHERA